MRRHEAERLGDVREAIEIIRGHLKRGGLSDGLVFDAVRIRLLEIGESVKALPPDLLDSEPAIDWPAIARFRDQLAHHYWDTAHSILQHIVDVELDDLDAAAGRLLARLRAE